MSNVDKKREQGKRRAQRLRDERKKLGITQLPVPLEAMEVQRLDEICSFFSHPGKPCPHAEAIQLMVHRVYAEIPAIREKLGTCNYCNEPLPEGCSKLKEGGLFKGDARCWHTTNRVRLFDPTNPEAV